MISKNLWQDLEKVRQWVKSSDPAASLWRESDMSSLHAKIMDQIEDWEEKKSQTPSRRTLASLLKPNFSNKRAGS